MVFGAAALAGAAIDVLSTGASNWDMGGMVSGLGTSGRGAKVDQKFQKLLANIDYKILRQGLHRDDIRDLVDLTVSRMDMYNVVGALLLTFALTWVCDNSVVSAEKESMSFPRWFSSVFIIHCFAASGYLLFSLWFSMHCSIVSKAQGTKLLLHFARLSIPAMDEINKLRVRFYSGGPLGRIAEKFRRRKDGPTHDASGKACGPASADDNLSESDEGEATCRTSMPGDIEDFDDAGYQNDSDQDFQRHLRLWVKERGKWLSYDAYSRVCMVVGMNQLLQAICYNLLASLWDVSLASAFLSIIAAKLLSLHVYMIDVSVKSLRQILGWALFEFSPPLVTLVLLHYMPPRDADAEDVRKTYGYTGLWALPLFAFHGMWTVNIAMQLGETRDAQQAKCAVVACPSGAESDSSDDSLSSVSTHGRRREAAGSGSDGLEHLPRAFLGQAFEGRHARSLYQVFHLDKAFHPAPGGQWFDHTPARIVRSFTLILAVWWFLSGGLHAVTYIWPEDAFAFMDFVEREARTGGRAGGARLGTERLSASWPEPASLFEVGSIHAAEHNSTLLVRGRFATFQAPVLPNGSLGPLRPLGRDVGAVLCGARGQGCTALAPLGSSWHALPLEEFCGRGGAPGSQPEPALLPSSWRLAAGALEEPGASRRRGLLAGWDGDSITVGDLRRELNGSWTVEPRFRLRPGLGRCEAGGAVCRSWRARPYHGVVALQLAPETRMLTVLSGNGTLDGWSLDRGALVGRWQLQGGRYTAMCNKGSQLYFARQGEDGPVLERSPLPAALATRGGEESAAGGRRMASRPAGFLSSLFV